MKKFFIFLLIVALLAVAFLFIAGRYFETPPEGAVAVLSNYPSLEYIQPGEFDSDKKEDGIWARYGYSTFVTEVDGTLAVMPNHIHKSSSVPGVGRSENYKFENVIGNSDGVFLDGERIIKGECVGMIPSYSNDKLLVFVSTENGGAIRILNNDSDDGSLRLCDTVISLEGRPRIFYCDWKSMFYDAPEEICLITDKGYVLIKASEYLNSTGSSPDSIEISEYKGPDWWPMARPTSVTRLPDGSIFIGEDDGVIGIHGENIVYYPIDYTAALAPDEGLW